MPPTATRRRARRAALPALVLAIAVIAGCYPTTVPAALSVSATGELERVTNDWEVLLTVTVTNTGEEPTTVGPTITATGTSVEVRTPEQVAEALLPNPCRPEVPLAGGATCTGLVFSQVTATSSSPNRPNGQITATAGALTATTTFDFRPPPAP